MTAGIFHFHTKIEQKGELYVFVSLLKLFTTPILQPPPNS